MHVLITGATGFVGRSLTDALVASGHAVSCLSRDPSRAQASMPSLTAAHAWTPGTALDPACLADIETVIHLAGENVSGRWNAAKRARVRASRIDGTRTLVDAILAAADPPRTLISASGIGFYGDRGETVLDEGASPGDDFFSSLCVEWEAEARRAEAADVRVAVLRLGIVIGPDGGAMTAMLTPFRLGIGGPLGSGRQWWSWIALEDAVGAIRHVVDNPSLHGPINLVAPAPIRQRDFALALGAALGRPAVLPAPGLALVAVLGEFAAEVLGSKRVVPERLDQAEFMFKHPDLAAVLRDALGPARPLRLLLPTLATATLGLAPYLPEPHLWGKLRWVAGGGVGMGPLDGLDLILHAAPWVWLLAILVLRVGASWTARCAAQLRAG